MKIYIVEIKVRAGFKSGKVHKQESAKNYLMKPMIELEIFSLQVICGTTAPLHLVCQNRKLVYTIFTFVEKYHTTTTHHYLVMSSSLTVRAETASTCWVFALTSFVMILILA